MSAVAPTLVTNHIKGPFPAAISSAKALVFSAVPFIGTLVQNTSQQKILKIIKDLQDQVTKKRGLHLYRSYCIAGVVRNSITLAAVVSCVALGILSSTPVIVGCVGFASAALIIQTIEYRRLDYACNSQ